MVTTHFLTMAKCKSCDTDFYRNDKWQMTICPSCVIQSLEVSTNFEWICNMDPPQEYLSSYNNVSSDEWYHVVIDKNENYRLINRRTMSMRPNKFGKVYYSNTLENCIQWIKKRKENK